MSKAGSFLVGGLIAVNVALLGLLYFRDRSIESTRAESAAPAAAVPAESNPAAASLARPEQVAPATAAAEPAAERPAERPADPEVWTDPPAPADPAPRREPVREPVREPRTAQVSERSGAPQEEAKIASREIPPASLPSDSWPEERKPASGLGDRASADRDDERWQDEAPAPKPEPRRRSLAVPSGTRVAVKLDVQVHSRQVRPGDNFEASLAEPLMAGETTLARAGSPVTGRVLEVTLAGKTKGVEKMKLTLDSIEIAGRSYPVEASELALEAEAERDKDAAVVGGGAAAGAVLGAILGGGKGAAKGAAVGAAAGTGVVLNTRGKAIVLESGARLDFTLESPIRVNLPPAPDDRDDEPRRDADPNIARRR